MPGEGKPDVEKDQAPPRGSAATASQEDRFEAGVLSEAKDPDTGVVIVIAGAGTSTCDGSAARAPGADIDDVDTTKPEVPGGEQAPSFFSSATASALSASDELEGVLELEEGDSKAAGGVVRVTQMVSFVDTPPGEGPDPAVHDEVKRTEGIERIVAQRWLSFNVEEREALEFPDAAHSHYFIAAHGVFNVLLLLVRE